jgi:hypothetical protein
MKHVASLLLLSATTLTAQTVAAPFAAIYSVIPITAPGIFWYGGTAFQPTDPNTLMVSPYPGSTIYSVPLLRDAQGRIQSAGQATAAATVGGTDGGLAYSPTGVLFSTWFGPNRLSQILPGSSVTNRVDNLAPLGIPATVGACAFVPAGLPGAGRLKIASYAGSGIYDVPLTPDGAGTFSPGNATLTAALPQGTEGLVYAPGNAPLLGGQLLVCEWGFGNIVAYQVDANGDPLLATRQVVVSGAPSIGGGAVDPWTGDLVFCAGGGQVLVLRANTNCGSFSTYGAPSPGGGVTASISTSGCAQIGQTVFLDTTGPAGALGLFAVGFFPTALPMGNVTVLQSMDVVTLHALDAGGNGALTLSIPFAPIYANSHLYMQCGFLDSTSPGGITASAAVDVFLQ